jgi:hypothetical protein
LLYAYDVNILGGSVHATNTEALVIVSKGIGQEVNADKTKTRVISRDHNAGRSHNIMIDNSSCVRVEVEEIKYLGTNLSNQNSILQQIKIKLNSRNEESFVFRFAI